jgi:hypothetical protein
MYSMSRSRRLYFVEPWRRRMRVRRISFRLAGERLAALHGHLVSTPNRRPKNHQRKPK